MRESTLILLVALVCAAYVLSRQKTGAVEVDSTTCVVTQSPATEVAASSAPAKVDFTTQIQPILSVRCMPCHFPGGSMHEQLPFDQPKTIKTLGEKLFTRIKDENEQRLIREFLAHL